MAPSTTAGQVVMLDTIDDSTWVWTGTTWARQPSTASPAATSDTIAYDNATNQVVAFDGTNQTTWTYTYNAPAPATPAVTTLRLPAGVAAQTYTATLSAVGGAAPYSWAVTSGSLPASLSLDPANQGTDVVEVEGGGFGDAGAGVIRDEGGGLVPGRRAGLDGAQVADLGAFAEGAGRGGGDLFEKVGTRIRLRAS